MLPCTEICSSQHSCSEVNNVYQDLRWIHLSSGSWFVLMNAYRSQLKFGAESLCSNWSVFSDFKYLVCKVKAIFCMDIESYCICWCDPPLCLSAPCSATSYNGRASICKRTSLHLLHSGSCLCNCYLGHPCCVSPGSCSIQKVRPTHTCKIGTVWSTIILHLELCTYWLVEVNINLHTIS